MPGKIDLLDEELFGNEAGEDEDPELLNAYFVEKPSFRRFYDRSQRFSVVRARKGIGKSALLARFEYIKKQKHPDTIVLYVKGSDLSNYLKPTNRTPNALINAWQQAICVLINLELGARIKYAFDDMSITLVENAELAGFRGRNLTGCLWDRLRVKLPVSTEKIAAADPQQLLRRYDCARDIDTWLLIDDIDATFLNQPEMRLEMSTFFSACRKIARDYRGIAIRMSVRTDVWSAIKQSDEALDKCEQYITDIKWKNSEARQILARKIHAYITRHEITRSPAYWADPKKDHEKIIQEVFLPELEWGGIAISPDRIIFMLSDGRPRWSAQLCKIAARNCVEAGRNRISSEDLIKSLQEYGRSRLDDLYMEHTHQCPKLRRLVETFAGGSEDYTTGEILRKLTEKIIRRFGPLELEGSQRGSDAIAMAHYLFKIGFIQGIQHESSDLDDVVKFEDRPELLRDPVNLDDGLSWRINPSYRRILRIKKSVTIQ